MKTLSTMLHIVYKTDTKYFRIHTMSNVGGIDKDKAIDGKHFHNAYAQHVIQYGTAHVRIIL